MITWNDMISSEHHHQKHFEAFRRDPKDIEKCFLFVVQSMKRASLFEFFFEISNRDSWIRWVIQKFISKPRQHQIFIFPIMIPVDINLLSEIFNIVVDIFAPSGF